MTVRVLAASGLTTEKDPDLDLDDPETNFMAMMKIRGDLAEKDFYFAFPGEAWAMPHQEKPVKCFRTFGLGAGRLEKVPEGYRIYSREVLYYLDATTGEIIEEWSNPWLDGKKVEVFHINNDPVNGVFAQGGIPMLAPPYPYVSYGDDIAFQWNFFIFHPAAMSRAEYPLFSSGDQDQHAELWGIMGKKSEVLNPDITSASSVMSWSRVCDWLPWMEMGANPSKMVFHSHSVKLMNGPTDLPREILDYTEKNFPKYLSAPTEWNGPQMTASAGEFKKIIDARRGEGG
jgi:hypothetical protein